MSDHATTTSADDAAKKPGFMDLFAVHLASRLVGRDHLLECFDGGSSAHSPRSSSSGVYVYWRTPLLHDINPGSVLSSADSETTQVADDWNMVFVDVTLEGDCSRREMKTTIGMLLQRGTECVYVTAKPLTYSQLASHCESVGIDIECTDPDAIAVTMGNALVGFVGHTIKFEKANGSCNYSGILPLRLYYKDLQERGTLEMLIGAVQDYNQRGAAMLLSNVANKDRSKNVTTNDVDLVHDTQLASELTKSFEKWWYTSLDPIVKETAAQSAVESEAPGGSVEQVSKPPASDAQSGIENVSNGAGASSAGQEIIPTESSTIAASTSSLIAASGAPSDATKVPEKKVEEPTKNYNASQTPASWLCSRQCQAEARKAHVCQG